MKMMLLVVFTIGLLAAHSGPATALSPFLQVQNATDMDTGYGIGLKRKFQIIPILAAEARASWYYTDGGEQWMDLNTFPLELVGRLSFGFLYGGIGAGYYIFSGDDFKPENSLGGFIFAGAEFGLFGLGAFAEIRWLQLEPDEVESLGGSRDLSGVGGNIGVTLPIGK
jgi:hypothetical protein